MTRRHQRQHVRSVSPDARTRRASQLWSGDAGVISQLGIDNNEPSTALDVNGALTLRVTGDPGNPADSGGTVMWIADGSTATEEAGDVYLCVNVGGVIKTFLIADFAGTYLFVSGLDSSDEIVYDLIAEDGFNISGEI